VRAGLVAVQTDRRRRQKISADSQNDTRGIGDIILIFPDGSNASAALEDAKSTFADAVTGGGPEPAAVGAGAAMTSGSSSDGSKARTVLLFTDGQAFVTLECDSAPNDPVPP